MRALQNGVAVEPLALKVDDLARTGDKVIVRWKGRASHPRPPPELTGFLEQLVGYAGSNRRSIVMRFEQVDHVNSSTIVALLVFMRQIEASNVDLTLCYDATARWQRHVFDAFQHFQGDRIRFVEVSAG